MKLNNLLVMMTICLTPLLSMALEVERADGSIDENAKVLAKSQRGNEFTIPYIRFSNGQKALLSAAYGIDHDACVALGVEVQGTPYRNLRDWSVGDKLWFRRFTGELYMVKKVGDKYVELLAGDDHLIYAMDCTGGD